MREIGGYFELELAQKEEYHANAIKLNSGRNALKYILKAQKFKKIFIPSFICNSLVEPLVDLNIEYEFYNINEAFEVIQNISLADEEKILYINYFGLKNKYIDVLVTKYGKSLIIDNTQAFFEKPFKNIDTIYSPRKFFGVSDGGYLYTNHILSENFKKDHSCKTSLQLFGRIDKDASSFYDRYQKTEQRLTNQPLKSMSRLTSRILESIDYDSVKMKREENFNYLHNQLKDINKLQIDTESLSIPFVYPFMSDDIQLRDELISNKIYVAKYWNEVLTRKNTSSMEYDFVNKIIPLPIDQRYNLEDMKRMVDIIKKKESYAKG